MIVLQYFIHRHYHHYHRSDRCMRTYFWSAVGKDPHEVPGITAITYNNISCMLWLE